MKLQTVRLRGTLLPLAVTTSPGSRLWIFTRARTSDSAAAAAASAAGPKP